MMPVTEERFQLALQVLSYRRELCWRLGDLRMFIIHNGRCSVCSCSAFRHDLFSLYPPRCKHECPTNIMKAHNSADLAGMTLPQFCNPDSTVRREAETTGPVTLELREEKTGTVIQMEAPVVTYARLEGPVTKASKLTLYEMQDRRCNACFHKKRLDDLTYDHRMPKSKSGPRDMANAELMCALCNHAKNDKEMFTFLWERWERELHSFLTAETSRR